MLAFDSVGTEGNAPSAVLEHHPVEGLQAHLSVHHAGAATVAVHDGARAASTRYAFTGRCRTSRSAGRRPSVAGRWRCSSIAGPSACAPRRGAAVRDVARRGRPGSPRVAGQRGGRLGLFVDGQHRGRLSAGERLRLHRGRWRPSLMRLMRMTCVLADAATAATRLSPRTRTPGAHRAQVRPLPREAAGSSCSCRGASFAATSRHGDAEDRPDAQDHQYTFSLRIDLPSVIRMARDSSVRARA